jgi:Xaa-Pro dipeptidase
VLAKYYDVGGVRIEDDLLVTEDGYENLTTTPKGDEALRIILGEDGEESAKEGRKSWFW